MPRSPRSTLRSLFGAATRRTPLAWPARRQRRTSRARLERVLGLEVLEDRTLLDAGLVNTALSAAQRQALLDGLQGLSNWAGNLKGFDKLAQQMPVVDQGIGPVLDAGTILQTRLFTPVQAANLPNTDALVTTLKGLNSSSGGLAVTVSSGVTGGLLTTALGSELQFNLVFSATRTGSAGSFDPGSGAAAFGLSLDPSAATTLTTTLGFSFTFGLDLTPGLSEASEFFIRVTSLSAGASAQLTNANFNAKVGFLGVQVQNATVTLNANLSAAVTDPDHDARNNITLAELQTTALGSLVSLTPTAATLTASLPVKATLGTYTASGTPTVTVSSGNVFAGAAPAVSVNSDFNELLNFTHLHPGDFSSLFNQLGSGLQAISSNLNVGTPGGIPFVAQQVNQVVSFPQTVSDFTRGLYNLVIAAPGKAPVNGRLGASAVFTLALDNAAPVTVTVTAASTASNNTIDDLVAELNTALHNAGLGSRVLASRSGNQVVLTITDGTVQQAQFSADPSNAAVTQLGFAAAQSASPSFKFTTIQELVPVLQAVLGGGAPAVNPQYDPATHALSFTVGFTDASFNQSVPLDFSSGLGPLTFEATTTASFAATANLNITLGVELAALDSVLTGTGAAPSNGVLSGDAHFMLTVGTNAPVSVTVPRHAGNTTLDNLVSDVNAALTAAGLGGTVTAGRFNNVITLTANSTAPLVLSAAAGDPTITDLHLPAGMSGLSWPQAAFLGAGSQVSVSSSISATNVNGSAALGILAVGVKNANAALTVGTGVTTSGTGHLHFADLLANAAGILTVQAPTATLSGHFPLTVNGVSLGINVNSPPAFDLALSSGNQLATTLTGSADAPTNGVLSGDAHFMLSVGGAPAVSVTVARNAGNTSLDNLVAQINAALATAGLSSAVTAGRGSNRITLSAAGLTSLAITSSSGDPTQTDLHLANATAGPAISFAPNQAFSDLLGGFQQFGTGNVVQTIQQVVNLIKGSNLGAFTAPLPIVNKSLADLLGTATAFTSATNTLASQVDPTGLKTTAQGIVSSLQAAIAALPSSVDLTLLTSVYDALNHAVSNANRTDIPVPVNLPAALVSTAGALADVIAALPGTVNKTALNAVVTSLQNATPSVQSLSAAVSSAFGLSAPNSLTFNFVNANTVGFERALVIDLHLQPSFVNQAINLSTLALPSLGPLQFNAGGTVNLTIGGTFDVNFGFDLKNPAPFLLDSTKFALTAQISTTNVTLSATIGGAGVSLGTASDPGSITLKNGAGNAAANVSITTVPAGHDIGQIPFSSLSLSSFKFNGVDAKFNAAFPIYALGTKLSNQKLTVTFDLSQPVSGSNPSITVPSDLGANLLGANFDFTTLINGINTFLGVLQNGLQSNVLGKLPIIGHDLNLAGGFIGDLRNHFLTPLTNTINSGASNLTTALQTAIFNELGASANGATGAALGILYYDDDNNPSTPPVPVPDAQHVAVSINPSTGVATINVEIVGTNMLHTSFNLGLGGLGLGVQTNGGVTLSLGYDLKLGFGLSKQQGFYFTEVTDPNDAQAKFNVGVTLDPNTSLAVRLFVIQLTATNYTDPQGNQTGFNGNLMVNLPNPHGNGQLTPGDLTTSIFDAKFQAAVTTHVRLHLAANLTADGLLPGVSADLLMDWGFGTGDNLQFTTPHVELDNITLQLGSFFSKIVEPILNDIDQFIKPIRPVLDLLNTQIPVISQLAQLLGQPPVTFTSAIGALGSGGDTVAEVIRILTQIDNLAQQAAGHGGNIGINFGNFTFTTDLTQGNGQPLDPNAVGAIANSFSPSGAGTIAQGVLDQINNSGDPDASGSSQFLSSMSAGASKDSGFGINFPIFQNPLSAVGILLGQPVTLITWDMPVMKAGFSFEWLFGPILPPVPLFVRIAGKLDVAFQLALGFDTRGLLPGHTFLDGLFFKDIPICSLTAEFDAGAELNVIVAAAGVEGYLRANVTASWDDPDHDGKVYLDEIAADLAEGPACIFTLSGKLTAGLDAYVKVGFDTPFGFVTLFSQSFDLASVTLLDFTASCPPLAPPKPAHVSTGAGEDAGIAAGVLVLNTGRFAGDRQPGHSTDGDETVSVKQLSPGVMEVTGFGQTADYGDASHPIIGIYGDGGAGNNVLTIDSGVTVDATLLGGPGNDKLTGGSGHNSISGGGGNDVLTGGPLSDTITGGVGNDSIYGNDGADLISVAGGNNYIDAGAGNDTVTGGSGNDTIYGGPGDDSLVGGTGHDELYGGAGNDTIFGGTGTAGDLIYGGPGNNSIIGSAGNDIIYADTPSANTNEGDNFINGGAGDDYLIGGLGHNTIYGGAGNDYIQAGPLGDLLYGNDPSNANGAGSDGNNTIQGGAGNDTIYGSAGNDLIYGNGGNDCIFGGGGNDSLYGGSGNDTIVGQGNSGDLIYGYGGNNSITGSDGPDVIYADAPGNPDGAGGFNTVNGAGGNDYIVGSAGHNTLYGGAGNDTIYGGPNGDFISGDAGDDYLVGGMGADTIYGGGGNDFIAGGPGNDLIYAGTGPGAGLGNTTVYGEAGNDVIYGNAGSAYLDGGDGNDFIYSGVGPETIRGGSGDDYIQTGPGDEQINGDSGNNLLVQSADVSMALTNTTLTGLGNDTLSNIQRVQLVGGPGNNSFDVSGWSGVASVIGGGGADTVVSTNDANFTLSDWNLSRSGGASFFLSGITRAALTGGPGDNSFDVSRWTGLATLTGGGGLDTVVDVNDANFVLTDTSLTSSLGGSFALSGINRALLGGGPGNNLIDASGFSGNASLYGGGGNDTLLAGPGDDYLDGGSGFDSLVAGSGSDILVGVNGSGDTLYGGSGDDVIYGSPAADSIYGGSGNARIYGDGGNDFIDGGSGNDTIDGGPGNDTIYGDGGTDLITTGNGNNLVYAASPSNVGGDGSVDDVYGGTGHDTIYGNSGNDSLFGQGNTSTIVPDSAGTTVNGNVPGPGNPVPPPPVPVPASWPPTLPGVSATLPAGPDGAGRWAELNGSASGAGLSNDPGQALDPSIAAGSAAEYVAWAAARANGTFVIDVATHTASAWGELAGSAHGGGISGTTGTARRPSITLDAGGAPLVAWTTFNGLSSDIMVARFDATANGGAGGWVALGNSLGAGGISGTGSADNAVIVSTAAGPVVAWLDSSGGTTNVYVRAYQSGSWVPLGAAGVASGLGLSQSNTSVSGLAVATDGSKVAVGWSQASGGTRQIDVREYNGGSWQFLGAGASNTTGVAQAPTLAYYSGQLYAAWQDNASGHFEIASSVYGGGTWTVIGNSAANGGVSHTGGQATQPYLSAGGGRLYLVWLDNRVANFSGNTTGLYVKRWNGSAFAEELPGDASYRGAGNAVAAPSAPSLAVDASGHPFLAWDDTSSGSPQVYVRGNTFDIHTVHYVNDSSPLGDTFTTATGSPANDGLSPATPKSSLTDVLTDAGHPLAPGDVILVDAGNYFDTPTFTSAANGVCVFGSPFSPTYLVGAVNLNGAGNVTLDNLVTYGGVAITGGSGVALNDDTFSGGGVTFSGGSGPHAEHDVFNSAGLTLTGAVSGAVVRFDAISGAGQAIAINGGGATGFEISGNMLTGNGTGLLLAVAAAGHVAGNRVAGGTALDVEAAFTGVIENNNFQNATTGVLYNAAADLSGNFIHDNGTGVVSHIAGTTNGLGFVGAGPLPNQIFRNATGVNLTGQMQTQHVYQNTTGVTGSGLLVSPDLDHANLIENNGTGVSFSGPVEFQRISRNAIGIVAVSSQLIAHDLIYRNTTTGIDVEGLTDVRIVSNTLFSPAGDLVHIANHANTVEVRDNVLWAQSGYDIYVANDSTAGFFSDYNDLHASGSGKIVFWTKDFTDVLDWQQDVAKFDLHSIGTTVVHPTWSQPRFVGLSLDDYRVFDETAAQRSSSPTIDAGDPLTDQALPAGYNNLLTNGGFENGLTGWTYSPSNATTQSSNPAPFEGSSYFFAGPNPTTTLEQTVDLVAAGYGAAQLDGHGLTLVFGARDRSLAESPVDTGVLTVTIYDGSHAVIGTPIVVQAANATDRWELLGSRLYLPAGARTVKFHYDAVRQSGSTNDAYLDGAFVYLLPSTTDPNLGAYGNTADEANQSHNTHLELRTPDLYKDWELNKPINIQWDSFGNSTAAPVVIDLYQDTAQGPQFVTHISTGTPDTGSFTWIAANSGITYGTYGLRVQVTLAGNPTVFGRSTETFTVPENTNTFFVNDKSTVGDEYTTAPGSNRNDGKLASAPKPYPNNVLRIYSLGPNQTLSVDSGDYPLLYPLLVSNIIGVGDDAGFKMQGAVSHATTLHHANPFTVAPVVELNNAAFMTLEHLTVTGGTIGLWVHNNSTNLKGDYLSSLNNSQDGFRVETGSTVLDFNHLTSTGNTGYGIYLNGVTGNLSDSTFSNNHNAGVYLKDTGATTVENNDIAANVGPSAYGLFVSDSVTNTTTEIGNADLSKGRGNRIHDNSSYGVYAAGQVAVDGNNVYGHIGAGNIGIYATNGAEVSRNTAHDNTVGIRADYSTIVAENRAYHNSDTGLIVDANAQVLRNTIYSNTIGVHTLLNYGANLVNNLIYANVNQGVLIDGSGYYGGTRELVNNTIYQPTGDAVHVQGQASGVHLRNNILWVQAGYDISIANEAQIGFQSDYNILYATGNGQVALWQGVARPTLLAWQTTDFTDQNSISQDPLFVSALGADGILGYSSPTNDGRDDDFHEQSLYGSYHGGSFAPVVNLATNTPAALTATVTNDANQSPAIDRGAPTDGYGNEPAPNGKFINIGAYGNTSQASISPAQYVLVTKPDGGEVWPEKQTFTIGWRADDLAGTGPNLIQNPSDELPLSGGLIPFWTDVVGTQWGQNNTGAPPYDGNYNFYAGNVPNAELSQDVDVSSYAAAIDAGVQAFAFQGFVRSFNEAPPDTSRIILEYRDGSGNVLSTFDSGAIASVGAWQQVSDLRLAPAGTRTVRVRLVSVRNTGTSNDGYYDALSLRPVDTVDVTLLHQGNPTPVLLIAGNVPTTGQFSWTVPQTLTPASDYIIRVTRKDGTGLSDTSNAPFTITAPISVYYVNDATVNPGDWTTAAGNDANDGLSPATPKASISALLSAYHLNPGDVIKVDTGTYNLSTNLILNSAASGITIQGYNDPNYPTRAAVLNRGNTNSGQYVIQLQGASNVTLDHLTITGGSEGVYANNTSSSKYLTISNSILTGNLNHAIYLDTTNDHPTISNDTLTNNYYAIDAYGTDATISHNTIGYENYHGIVVRGARAVVDGNDVGIGSVGNQGVGIDASYGGAAADRMLITNNKVHDNNATGMTISGAVLATGNEVYYQTAGYSYGVYVSNGAEFRNNVVHDNFNGVQASYTSLVDNNRIYLNSNAGLVVTSSGHATANRVYNNGIGVYTGSDFGGPLDGNLVYQNTTVGILVDGSGYYGSTPDIVNNVVYQTSGDAIHVQGSTNNVRIRNDVLWDSAGTLINVNPESERTFQSDYNILYTTGTGKIGLWEGRAFTTRVDWLLELGFDKHSLTADPQFVNPAGPDGFLGFKQGGGLSGTYYNTNDLSGSPVLTRTDPSINFTYNGNSPAPGINATNWSVRWTGYVYVPTAGNYDFYTLADDGLRLYLDGTKVIDQWAYNGGVEDAYAATGLSAGWHALTYEMHQTTGGSYAYLRWDGPGLVKQIISPTYLGVSNTFTPGDYGADDDFHLQTGSPAIDHGDLTSYYFNEPAPDGDRVDIGAYGNTTQAGVSPGQLLQVLSPNGLEKLQQGQQVAVQWRSAGLTTNRPVLLINANGGIVDNFLADNYLVNGYTGGSYTFSNPVDTSGAVDPAPAAVYQSYSTATNTGQSLVYKVPVPDGNYTVRLHFADPSYSTAGSRKFDIRLQGTTVKSAFDIAGTAGGRYKATVQGFAVTATGGAGITIDLLSVTGLAILSGYEILAANPGGSANPTANLDVSSDNGATWSPLAANLAMDRFGRGTYLWTVPANEPEGNGYRVRVSTTVGTLTLQAASADSFLVANNGHDYYVNDGSTAGDVFTTAVGNNANSGKNPGQPMASVAALIAAYSFGPGDVIHVDTGNYSLSGNINLTALDSGLTIQGPSSTTALAVLNRNNLNGSTYVFQLTNAGNVTLDHLQMTGASIGVYAAAGSNSTYLTVSNSRVYNNVSYGMYLDTSNNHLTISNTEFYGTGFGTATPQNYGVWLYGDDTTVTGSDFHTAGYDAIVVRGARDVVSNNYIHYNGTGNSGVGIDASFNGAAADAIQVTGNRVAGSTASAISAGNQVIVTSNEVYENLTGGATGISLGGAAVVRGNFVHDNGTGIAGGSGLVTGNRVYNNTTGIYADSGLQVQGNRVYNNTTGIYVATGFNNQLVNNIIYNNTAQGLHVSGSGYYGNVQQILNNTFYQPASGNAVLVDGSASHTHLRDNIFWVGAGYALTVAADSQIDFQSDYNLFDLPGSGKLARWQNTDFTTPSDWFYQVGQDQHSTFGDPQFVNPAGADGLIGFQAGGGLSGTYYNTNDLSGSSVLTRTDPSINFAFNGNSPAPGVNATNWSVRWTGYLYVPTAGNYHLYTTADDGLRLYLDGTKVIDQWTYNGGVEDAYTATGLSAGWHTLTYEMHQTTGNSYAYLSWDGPNITKRIINSTYLGVSNTFTPGDYGADDDFHLQPTSPAIDRGSPTDPWVNEPAPNGDRVNVGNYGNTADATSSPAQIVQVLSPNGLEKFEQGQQVTVQLRSAGLTQNRTVALYNAGTGDYGAWKSASAYQQNGGQTSFTNTVDLSGIVAPAPAGVYNTYAYGDGNVGGHLKFQLPLPDGTYVIRLHFVEPSYTSAGQRKFDIFLNGTKVKSGYDVFADAGARFRATTQTFSGVVAAAGGGVLIDLVSTNGVSAVLSAIDVQAVNPSGVAAPTVNLLLSTDGGATWNSVATNLPLDYYGQASYVWTAGPPTAGVTALFRAVANDGTQPQDDSDGPFRVSNNGTDFYVSPTGDDTASGKDPAAPMKTLAALVDAYVLDPSDTVHVAAGTYTLYRNIVIPNQDSGVTIQGPPATTAILNRSNTNTSRWVFELQNANNVTLDHLQMTGAESAVVAVDYSNSNNLTVSNSQLFADSYSGISLGANNNHAVLVNNTFYGVPGGTTADDQQFGIILNGGSSDHVVSGNTIYDHAQTGLTLRGARSVASGNTIYGNRTGIDASFSGAATDRETVSGNTVHDNSQNGITGSATVLVSGNRVYGQTSTNYEGIGVYNGAEAAGNEVFGNANGLYGNGGSYLHDNRVYNNSNIAVGVDNNTLLLANKIYSNSIGVRAYASYYGQIANNLIYANTNRGLSIQNSSNSGTAEVLNNTIYQPVGDAIRLDGSARNNHLANNLLWVQSGYDVYVAPDSQTGFVSDYNLLNRGTDANAHVGYWANAIQDQLANWHAASGQDGNSVTGDPGFVDIDGADNVLGYTAANGGYDGGKDDNFYLAKLSPAIDRGDPWNAPPTDIEGFPRKDDPGVPNAGRPDLAPTVLGSSQFTATGTAQNWRSNGNYFTYNFAGGFSFPYYDGTYTSVYVSTEGFLQFASNDLAGNGANTTAELLTHRRIAALWDNIRTDGTGNDIFVDTSVSGQVKFRWNATNEADNSAVNFSITLFSTGQIRFDYGAGNTNLTPTVGVSMGNNRDYKLVSGYDGATTLTNANSIQFSLQPGYTDIGAYEFRGNSNDVTPPTVAATNPAAIHAGTATGLRIGQIQVTFSEEVNPIDANAPAVYELRSDGPDHIFDTADDVVYVLTPHYTPGQNTVVLNITVPGGALPPGNYRFTIFSNLNTSIHDLAGLRLDGDGDGTQGGNYVRFFSVLTPAVTSVVVNGNNSALAGAQRSLVSSLVYTFNEAVTLSAGAFTIALHQNVTVNGKTGQTAGVLPTLNWNTPDGGLTWVVTFSGTGVVNGSIADGVYDITLSALAVADVGGRALSADRLDTFYRLFGDTDGNRKVNNADLAAFAAAFNKRSNQAGYLAYLDYDGSGRIDNGDLAQFANRFNNSFSGF